MEKTVITKVAFYVALQLFKFIAKRTDNKIDDKGVDYIERTFYQ